MVDRISLAHPQDVDICIMNVDSDGFTVVKFGGGSRSEFATNGVSNYYPRIVGSWVITPLINGIFVGLIYL